MIHDDPAVADIVQHKIASLLSRYEPLRNRAIFKGGTMLRVCMFENYRLSEDLDFSLLDIDVTEFYDHFREMLSEGTTEAISIRMPRHDPAGTQYVEWGLGEYVGMIVVEAEPAREFESKETQFLPIQDNHPDIASDSDTLLCSSMLAVASSKYNCLGNRFKGRDIFDMHWMISQNILGEAWENYLKIWHQFRRPSTPDTIVNRLEQNELRHREAWEEDVSAGYISPHINFDKTFLHLLNNLSSIWKTQGNVV